MKRELSNITDKDALLALLTGVLAAGWWFRQWAIIGIGLILLLGGLSIPFVLRAVGWSWRQAARATIGLSQTLLLGLLFYAVISPIGLIRRWLGRDEFRRRDWKRGQQSLFEEHDQTYTSHDLQKPF